MMTISGFYIIKQDFFDSVKDPYLKSNKDGNRPFYYCFKEEVGGEDIFWMIPLSSRVQKYRAIIEKKEKAKKPCHILHIAKLPNGKESVFLIQDIFPIKQEYIEREYTLGANPLVLPYQNEVAAIETKAKRIVSLIKNGVKLTPTSPDVLRILRFLSGETI